MTVNPCAVRRLVQWQILIFYMCIYYHTSVIVKHFCQIMVYLDKIKPNKNQLIQIILVLRKETNNLSTIQIISDKQYYRILRVHA